MTIRAQVRQVQIERGVRADAPMRVEVVQPRGLSREQAARYVGIGATKFDELVGNGAMPAAKNIGTRKIWDRMALDAAFEELPSSGTDPYSRVG